MKRFALHAFAAVAALLTPWHLPAFAQSGDNLSLRQAVTLALQNSGDLKLARLQYAVALNEANVDRASFRPNIYTGAGYVYTRGFPSLPGGGPPSLFQLDYSQSIFNPLLKGQQKAAEDRAKTQKAEIDRVQDEVMLRTANAYLELAKVRHSLELMRKERSSAEKILQVTQDRVSANQELPIEVTRSQLILARTEERIIKLQDRDEILASQIRSLTGIPDAQSMQVETIAPSFSIDQQEDEIVNLALQNSLDVREAENERSARAHVVRGAHLSYWPTVDLVGQYSILSKFNNYGEFYKTFERNNLNVGLEITIPLFAAKTSANVALAKSELKVAELSVGNKRQEARLDVQQKARSVREQDATREVARLDLKLAQQTVELVQARFDQGRATLQDIEQARLEESDKWLSFLDADFVRQEGQLILLQATGQLAKVLQ